MHILNAQVNIIAQMRCEPSAGKFLEGKPHKNFPCFQKKKIISNSVFGITTYLN